tara:strand:+ start:164 stop:442 length:279 start_codon:yes stop_codon:yes gene_type:complete
MNRRERREMEKKMGKEVSKNLSEKISQFGKLPERCDACQNSFDKKDMAMIQSWSVVVKQETVRLFCPDCIKKTQEAIDASPEIIERFAKQDS